MHAEATKQPLKKQTTTDTYILCCMGTVAVDRYYSTDDHAKTVDAAVVNFAHLIRAKAGDARRHRFSFADLADLIEANYSLDDPKTAETVRVLRYVQSDNDLPF